MTPRTYVRRLGRLAGPLVGLALYALIPDTSGLDAGGRAAAAVAAWMATWWLTEAVELYVTALLPVPLLPLAGAAPSAGPEGRAAGRSIGLDRHA